MLNYHKTETFLIEDVDHVYHIVKLKLEHCVFIFLTLVLPLVLNFRFSLGLLLMACEYVIFLKMTNAEIQGRPLQYNQKFVRKVTKVKILKHLVKFKIALPKESYRGDF